eukprot:11939432-Heterocapsa_arctica.AAC.1
MQGAEGSGQGLQRQSPGNPARKHWATYSAGGRHRGRCKGEHQGGQWQEAHSAQIPGQDYCGLAGGWEGHRPVQRSSKGSRGPENGLGHRATYGAAAPNRPGG